MKIQGSTGSNQISALNKREFEVRKEEFLEQALPELKSRGMSVIRIEDNITMRDPLGSIYGYVSIIWEADTDDPNYQRGQSEPLNCNSPWNRSYSKRGCYVATCVYGSYDCPQVWTLRRYRDYILARTWYGRAFIRTYYTISPTLVKWFGHTKWFKDMWKPHLDNMIRKLNMNGVQNTPYQDKQW